MSYRLASAAMSTVALLASAGVSQAEVVVIVNPKNAASSLSSEQVANVFLGKNSDFMPVDLAEASAARSEFYTKVTGKDAAQVKAIWSRLIFTSNGSPPKMFGSSTEAVKYVAGNEKAIAYVESGVVDASVKAVLTVK